MATLYVENIPDDLYEALRSQAKARRRSIAAEVLALLGSECPHEKGAEGQGTAVPTNAPAAASNLHNRRDLFPSAEEMIREDRER